MRRLALLFLVTLLVGAAIAGIGIVRAVGRGGGESLPGGKVLLTYRLAAPLPDYPREPELPLPGVETEESLADLWSGLSAARDDDRVAGLALHVRNAAFGLAKAQELRRQIANLVEAGKPVKCYFESTGEGSNGTLEYYVASACSSISLAPAEVALLGLYFDSTFLRGSLDKLKIEPSFLTAGEFKSAAEAFTEERHSAPARTALDAVLDGYFGELVAGISAGRDLPAEAVTALFDRGPLSADEALAANLVDQVAYPDEFEARLDAELGDDLRRQSLLDYGRRIARRRAGGDRIAVLFAQGTIVRGRSGVDSWTGETYLGSDDLADELEDLADDDGVKAVVLRVDSPGGSALASDLILRRVELLAREKPVVVSMSDVAASGGYYIAARANEIVAEAGTLTGSIGVVAGKFGTERFQRELLGATHDPLQRGAFAGLYSGLRPFDETERALMQSRLDATYERFLAHVAEGREMSRETVAAVAEGRVWTGSDALAVGLVDRLGGLDEAVAAAREAAGLEAGEGTIELLPETPGFFQWLTAPSRPRLSADWRALLARLATPRAPFELELPADLARLARPF